jgi:hypothetical protein
MKDLIKDLTQEELDIIKKRMATGEPFFLNYAHSHGDGGYKFIPSEERAHIVQLENRFQEDSKYRYIGLVKSIESDRLVVTGSFIDTHVVVTLYFRRFEFLGDILRKVKEIEGRTEK